MTNQLPGDETELRATVSPKALEQCLFIELSAAVKIFHICIVQNSDHCPVWVLSTWNVASVTGKLKFYFTEF